MSKITNLIGTTWRLVGANLDTIQAEYGVFNITAYGVGIIDGSVADCQSSLFYVGYQGVENISPLPYDSVVTVYFDTISANIGNDVVSINNFYYPYWPGDGEYYYEFTITGGDDISNPLFIDFINTYGTLVSGGEPSVPTAESVKANIQSLITASNAKTGKTDANLTDAVKSLIEGYESGEDSALPIEVATEAEMTALLSTAEVGAIYKYTGETTDTYENGALYVVEESE